MRTLTNEQYLASCGITPAHVAYSEMLARMEHYGENKWWMSDDPRVRAYYQVLEMNKSGYGFYSLAQCQRDVAVLLDRPVLGVEFATKNAAYLRQSVERAWEKGQSK